MNVSGLYNNYKFNLHSFDASPVTHIRIHTHRTEVKENYITLGIREVLQVKAGLVPLNTYVTSRLQSLGAHLSIRRMHPGDKEVLSGNAKLDEAYPYNIIVSNYVDARGVIDDLFAHKEMSAGDRADIETALRELEKSAKFSDKRAESISVAQREVIQSFISPYVDDIKLEAPDNQTAKRWIQCGANAISICGPSVKTNLPSLLFTACRSGHGKSASFYESLFAISRIYASMGDLEGTLVQLGQALPAKELVQQAILDLFN